ncbi:MAG TPA: cupin domain-containing protein [Ideonella sp.]|nr:cupin domain-containing protein [Ideonella sp.]
MSLSPDALRALLIRNFDDALAGPERQSMPRPPLYHSVFAGLSEGTAARKLGAGIDIVAPHSQSCPYHFHHAQEEMFIVLEGEGTLRVAGERLPIRAGDVIFIPPGPEYPHHILNTSDAPLKYLSLSTQERPEICEYPDSGKYSASAPGFRAIQRREASLDYWDGEP